ncbi:Lipin [Macleaya cordata]|uniref:phosphatidate phosphatase n=1 Tax=Macleaya cordata TaxID=56857 RepID=A0A200QJ92_MACCD|nr:Lipin [Macleaya cordata]
MFAVEKLSSYITQGVYTVSGPFHPFGGAVDIIVVQQQDGSFKSSPWNVRFGKFQGVLKTKEKVVNISVNGVEAKFHMYLDHKGEAYFLKEVNAEEEGNSVALSHQSSFGYDTDEQTLNGKLKQSKSCDLLDSDLQSSVTQIAAGSQKIVMTTNSSRSPIFGFMFGRKSAEEDDDRRDEGSGAVVERAGSLERAEIAADLLEVNWSTNFSTNRAGRGNSSRLSANSSRLSASSLPAEVYEDFQVNNDENSFDDHVLPKLIGESDGKMGNGSESGLQNTNCSDEVSSPRGPCLRSQEQDIELFTLEGNVSDEVVSAALIGSDKFDAGNAGFEERQKGSMSEITTLYEQNPHLDKFEVGPDNMQYGIEQSFDVMNGCSRCGVSDEESGALGTPCESSESTGIAVDVPGKEGLENVKPFHGEYEVALEHVHPIVLSEMEETIKINSQHESEILLTKENLNDSYLLSDGDSSQFPNAKTIRESERSSVAVDVHSIDMESHSSVVIHQETIIDILTQSKSLDTEQVEGSENQSPVTSFSDSCLSGNSTLGKHSTAQGSHSPTRSVDQIVGSTEEAESRGICISSSLSHSIHQDEEEENKMNKLHPSLDFVGDQELSMDNLPSKLSNSSMAPSESSSEDQFLFSDIDDFVTSGARSKDFTSPEPIVIENDPVVTLDDIEDLQNSGDINHDSSLSTEKFATDCSPDAFESLIEESKITSTPMSIFRSQKGAGEGVERMIESLPILHSHIDNLESSDAPHPLSHSLGSSSEKLECRLPRKDISSSLNFSSDSECHLLKENSTVEDTRFLEELKNMSNSPAFEISLCKHMLHEGMGVDAASQAFDAEKVDFGKFVSLVPGLVKDDRLIVRIGGRYFPWHAAAPVILGMTSLGHEQISEPKGMIAVDRVEETLEDDTSNTIVSSGGSWRIWPFTFKKSTSMNSVQSAPDGTKDSDADNASESTSGISGDKNSTVVKVAKKKVKSIVPTSEQLDTLNLKEGQNMVTFTFSTAMLGKQQVDARIYLWKWNTRIVISDVDGTITRSDVLGQFMPLVGKDWSQTGVAHLFSAIKENGYQLLFLSARAISQAYITRQFLLNLKQDGKALPDGPVVISPDGLFPSLFREVIRRAPHEFKIACLNDIKALFPPDCNPFYAGFGNRDTDEFSYLKVGIPKGKIFIINPKGEVAVNRWVDTKSYTSLHALVNGMFPPMSSAEQMPARDYCLTLWSWRQKDVILLLLESARTLKLAAHSFESTASIFLLNILRIL